MRRFMQDGSEREKSTNIDDRRIRKTKVDKYDQRNRLQAHTPQGGYTDIAWEEVVRLGDKYAIDTANKTGALGDGKPTEKSRVRRYTDKKLEAADKKGAEKGKQAPPPSPRKRPSQVYIEAPKPKKMTPYLRGPIKLK